MKTRTCSFWIAALLGLSAAGTGGSENAVLDEPWRGAMALRTREDYPGGIAIDGANVVYNSGLTQVGDHAVRIAPLQPATPPASRILVADPGGVTPGTAPWPSSTATSTLPPAPGSSGSR